MLLVFGAVFASFQYSLQLINVSRAKLSAIAVANERMEFFRSLPYDSVGTVNGLVPGVVASTSIISLNGIDFTERVIVGWVDDPADGFATADGNNITRDYKLVKIEYTWTLGNQTGKIDMISNIVPRSIETTVGGGSARINVIDANAQLLPGARVQLLNASTSPINEIRFTDINGSAIFSGAPVDSNYELVITALIGGRQYSTTGTYRATVANPNPSVAPFSVLEADVSTLTFQIGELSDLTLKAYTAINEDVFTEEFTDLSAVATSTAVSSVGNRLVLASTAGVYESSGTAMLGPITPVPLLKWQTLKVAAQLPAGSSYRTQVFTSAVPGVFDLVPESELPGNNTGFSSPLINLSRLDTFLFPSIYIRVTLQTTNTAFTPNIDELSLFYRQSATPLTNSPFAVRGNKVIGTTIAALPIYKYSANPSTDVTGERVLPDLEFDEYTFNFAGRDILEACSQHPLIHQAGVDGVMEILLGPDLQSTLRVSVQDASGLKIPGATIRVRRAGYDVEQQTSSCGQSFFSGGGLGDAVDYELTITSRGYASVSLTPFTVAGDTVTTVVLLPL